jgi:hypothetical protein
MQKYQIYVCSNILLYENKLKRTQLQTRKYEIKMKFNPSQ